MHLRYLYCDEITLEADTVLSTLYVAKKYIVPHLCRACVLFLETSLTARNACLLLSQSRLFEEPELMSRCWEVIDAQAQLALHSEGFTEIDIDTLKQILQRETLNCKEVWSIFLIYFPVYQITSIIILLAVGDFSSRFAVGSCRM